MTQSNIDAVFLREYADFTSFGPVAVSEALHNELVKAHGLGDFDRVAHLQVRLHAEMVLSLETTGALLLAYPQWDGDGGIMRALFSYRPDDVLKFMRQLEAADYPLRLLCFPPSKALICHYDDIEFLNEAYTNEELKKSVADMLRMYLTKEVRDAYNKIKHAGMYVRDPEILRPSPGKPVEGNDIYVMLYRKKIKSIDFASFPVKGDAGLCLAEKYLSNTRVIAQRSRKLAGFVAFCLENKLLTARS